jgi:hypothetical protein
VKLKDYLGRKIDLTDASWEHIRDTHPEVSLEEIQQVLADPLEVRENPRQNFVELFYQAKTHREGKSRFRVVVVKVLADGNYISTAMTTSAMKSGKTIYRKDKEK